jgi:hypothetical protein
MKRWLCSAILGCVLTVTFGRIVNAECVGFSLDHYVKYADVMFFGVVKDIREVDASKQIVTLEVSRVWERTSSPDSGVISGSVGRVRQL